MNDAIDRSCQSPRSNSMRNSIGDGRTPWIRIARMTIGGVLMIALFGTSAIADSQDEVVDPEASQRPIDTPQPVDKLTSPASFRRAMNLARAAIVARRVDVAERQLDAAQRSCFVRRRARQSAANAKLEHATVTFRGDLAGWIEEV